MKNKPTIEELDAYAQGKAEGVYEGMMRAFNIIHTDDKPDFIMGDIGDNAAIQERIACASSIEAEANKLKPTI
jgi:hypothetical protein